MHTSLFKYNSIEVPVWTRQDTLAPPRRCVSARHSSIHRDTSTPHLTTMVLVRTPMLQRLAARAAASSVQGPASSLALRQRAATHCCAHAPSSPHTLLSSSSISRSTGGAAHFATSAARERFASSYARQKRAKEEGGAVATEAKRALNVSRIAVIGGGNMAEAIVTGVLSEELLPREKLVVSDPNPGASVGVYQWHSLRRVSMAHVRIDRLS